MTQEVGKASLGGHLPVIHSDCMIRRFTLLCQLLQSNYVAANRVVLISRI